MDDREVYIILLQGGLTPEGACGMMGNMKAESSMKANIAQRGMTTLTDEQYTIAADMGTIDFVNDQVGYGYCQWTFPPRKAALLAYAQSCGVSVGDGKMQTHFCLKELTEDYLGVYKVLTTSHNLKECSDIVCTDFERPAYPNLDARYQFALEFYDKYGKLNPPNVPIIPELNNLNSGFAAVEPDISSPSFQTPDANSGFSFGNFMSGLWGNITGNNAATVSAKMPVLKLGDQGAGVAAIQVALKYHKVNIGDTGTLGIWENGTTMGLKTFQQQHGINPSGQMDAATWEALFK